MEYVLRKIHLPSLGASGVLRRFGAHLHDHFIPHHRNNYHPHILGSRSLALFSGLLVAVKIFNISLVSLSPAVPAFSSAVTTENIITLTNQARQGFGLGVLSFSPVLEKAAQAKAEDMLKQGYFAHTSPSGKTPWEFIESAGYTYLAAGENLAVNFTQAESATEAWMNSASHKANILSKNYEEIGIGIVQGKFKGQESIFVVQMFGAPVQQNLIAKNQPTIVQTSEIPSPTLESTSNLSIGGAEAVVESNSFKITAKLSQNTVKAVASFGERAVMLDPKSEGVWEGTIPLASLQDQNIRLKVFDLSGSTAESSLGYFSNSTVNNFNVLGATISSKVKWLGQAFDPKSFEQKFFLLFIAGILASLILAIAIRRHVQHVMMIANASFVAIFAGLLLMMG